MFKRQKVERFFSNKLECSTHERRHTEFVIRLQGRRIPLPMVLTLSRGSHDVSHDNLKGLAQDLGLSRRGLQLGILCPLSRPCVLLCCSARLIQVAIDRNRSDPIAHNEEALHRARESLEWILTEVESATDKPVEWTADEQKEFGRVKAFVRLGVSVPVLRPPSERWLTLALPTAVGRRNPLPRP